MKRPSSCASCGTLGPSILTSLDDRTVWLCLSCYDGADHSLPVSIDGVAALYDDAWLRRLARELPRTLSCGDAADLGVTTPAAMQRLFRARRRRRM